MTTLTQARRAILEGLGRGGVYTSTGAGSTSTVVCSTFKSTELPTDHLAYAWLHVPSASSPRQRRVKQTGLAPGTGTITVDDVFGSSIGSAIDFELSPLLPPIDGGVKGMAMSLNQCANEAARHLCFQDEISVTITTNATLSLTTWASWLDRAERLVAILEPSPFGEAPIDASWREIEFDRDAEAPTLRIKRRFGVATGTLTLKVLRPADSWIAVGGTWAESTVGLVNESDIAKPDLRHFREAGLVFAYQTLADARSGPRREEYRRKYEQQLALARTLPFWDHTRDDLLPRPGGEGASEGQAA